MGNKKRTVVQKELYFNLVLIMGLGAILLIILTTFNFSSSVKLVYTITFIVWVILSLIVLWKIIKIRKKKR